MERENEGYWQMINTTAPVYFTHVVLLVCVFNIYILPGNDFCYGFFYKDGEERSEGPDAPMQGNKV